MVLDGFRPLVLMGQVRRSLLSGHSALHLRRDGGGFFVLEGRQ